MRILKFILPIFFILLSVSKIEAQKEFSRDSVKFLKQMQNLLYAADKEKFKSVLADFEGVWFGQNMNPELRGFIYDIALKMQKKRLPASPAFEGMLVAVTSFVNSGKDEESFINWKKAVEDLINSKNRSKISIFMKTSALIFNRNALFSNAIFEWRSGSDDYKFEIRNKKPYIVFDKTMSLICISKTVERSYRIQNTKGVFNVLESKWEGESGKVDWEGTELNPDKNYALFGKYRVNIDKNSFKVDSVTFHTTFYKEPLLGKMRHKLEAKEGGRKASYPIFESYSKRLFVKNIFDLIDYEGGFNIVGDRLRGSGTIKNPASITIHHKGRPFFQGKAVVFFISENTITSNDCKIKFNLDKDSIVHQGLKLRFLRDSINKKGELALLRNEEGKEKAPYFNSFHMLEMDVQAVYWKLDEMNVHFRGQRIGKNREDGGARRDATFESMDYFSMQRYNMLQGLDQVHPLVQMYLVAKDLDTNRFNIVDLARQMKINPKPLRPMVLRMALQGFIDYNQKTEDIHVYDKVFKYVWAASKKEDYDQLIFRSNIGVYKNLNKFNKSHDIDVSGIDLNDKDNAKLNLLNYDLTIRGLEKVVISPEQFVQVWPRKYKLIVGKNRDFDGQLILDAGHFNFYCNKTSFTYDEFKFDLSEVDSTKLNTLGFPSENGDARGRYRVRNKIDGIKGVLYVDHIRNKSGAFSRRYPGYPKLDSKEDAYVYYERKDIQEGAYKKNDFYFQIDPFLKDSLDEFLPEDFYLEGTLVSAGVFPDFKEKLKIQKDYSLGFIRNTPESGYPLYASKGSARYFNEIRLSNDGLRGGGDIKYLNSLASSEDFVFLPDSTHGTGKIKNTEAIGPVDQPEANGEGVLLAYNPSKDVMSATSQRTPVSLMNGETALEGTLMIQPEGLTGSGFMNLIGKADVVSKEYKYKHNMIDADTASFALSGMDPGIIALETDNINLHVDFDKRFAELKSNGEESEINLAPVEYVCYMDKLKWLMDTDEMQMESTGTRREDALSIDTDAEMVKSNFYSVHEDQDSLNFKSAKAIYDIRNIVLECYEVPHVNVADARIFPDSNALTVRHKAQMDSLNNASILANSVTKYHNIYEADLKVNGRWKYSGKGKVNYIDENKNEFPITLTRIDVDTTRQTFAKGKVLDKDMFMLNDYFSFYGDVNLTANNKLMHFMGNSRIAYQCDTIKTASFSFISDIDPNEVMLPIEKNKMQGKILNIGTGIALNDASVKIYPAFMSKKTEKSHPDVIAAYGFIKYNKSSNEYEISNKDKLQNRTFPGDFVSLDVKNCMIYGDGRFNFGLKTDQFKLLGIGRGKQNVISKEFDFKGSIRSRFPIPNVVMDKLVEKLYQNQELADVDFDKAEFEKSLRELAPPEQVDKMISNFSVSGKFKKFPEELKSTIFFTDIKMDWFTGSSRYKGFKSNGRIGIGTLGTKEVFKYVNGSILLNKKRKGSNDVVYILLELDRNNWFYFEYQGSTGILKIHSSDKEFNQSIIDLKGDQKEFKGSKDERKVMILPGTDKAVKDFRRKVMAPQGD